MMGTIGDRFGDLAALLGAEGEAAPGSAGAGSGASRAGSGASGASRAGSGGGGSASSSQSVLDPLAGERDVLGQAGVLESAGVLEPSDVLGQADALEPTSEPTLESTIAATIAELNRVEISDLDFDNDFTSLDLSGLPLWALVAEVERFLGRKFTDDEVGSWDTPRDILRAAESNG